MRLITLRKGTSCALCGQNPSLFSIAASMDVSMVEVGVMGVLVHKECVPVSVVVGLSGGSSGL